MRREECVKCNKSWPVSNQKIEDAIVHRGVPYMCTPCRTGRKYRTWLDYERAWISSLQNGGSQSEGVKEMEEGTEKGPCVCRWCQGTKMVTLFTTSKPCLECTTGSEVGDKVDKLKKLYGGWYVTQPVVSGGNVPPTPKGPHGQRDAKMLADLKAANPLATVYLECGQCQQRMATSKRKWEELCIRNGAAPNGLRCMAGECSYQAGMPPIPHVWEVLGIGP